MTLPNSVSAVRGTRRTPAALARQRPQPAPTYTQAELRERRIQGYVVRLEGDWSFTAEVAAICVPLADRIAERGSPRTYIRYVEDLADAAHQAIHVVVGLLAEADAQRRTRHLPIDERGRALAVISTLVERPTLPEIDCDAVAAGTWAQMLVELAEPYGDALARLLANATVVVSSRVLRAFGEVDHAARALERRLDRDDQPRPSRRAQALSAADHARAELARLGVTL